MINLPKGKGQAKGELLDLDTVPSLTKITGEKTITPISLILYRYRTVKLFIQAHPLIKGSLSPCKNLEWKQKSVFWVAWKHIRLSYLKSSTVKTLILLAWQSRSGHWLRLSPGETFSFLPRPRRSSSELTYPQVRSCMATLPVWPKSFVLFSCWVMSNSFATLWTVACQAPLSLGFSRQEYWSGLSFLSPGDLPDPGTEPRSPALGGGSLPLSPSWGSLF